MAMHHSIFTDYAVNLLEKDFNKTPASLKDHPQIPLILDTLGRQHQHHLLLTSFDSRRINNAFIHAIAHHIAALSLPLSLRNARFIGFDVEKFSLHSVSNEQIAQDFHRLLDDLRSSNQRLIVALSDIEPLLTPRMDSALGYLGQLIQSVLTDDQWRIITFLPNRLYRDDHAAFAHLETLFALIKPSEITQADTLALLKEARPELEQFHHAIISDDTVASASAMASHYLPGHSSFDKAMQLLDSAAAYASRHEKQEQPPHKNSVTTQLITRLIANWTQIPITHLQQNTFQATRLIETVRKKIVGQDAAIESIGLLLQNACLKLHEKKGPLCSLLLVGSADVGKSSLATAIAEHLYGHQNALLRVIPTKTHYTSLAEVDVMTRSDAKQSIRLLEAIQQTPYAVILIEHIDQMAPELFDLVKDMVIHGYVFDPQGRKYDFRHAILIMTTRIGTESISQFTSTKHQQKSSQTVDLMQLVLNHTTPEEPAEHPSRFSLPELIDAIMPELEMRFSTNCIQQMHVIPLLPLDYAAIEKIIRLKIKTLVKQLDVKFGIELHYVPDVIKFLAYELFWRKSCRSSFNQLLEQHLYSAIAHEMLSLGENKPSSKRLLLQLNDSGQVLKCECMTGNETTLYHL